MGTKSRRPSRRYVLPAPTESIIEEPQSPLPRGQRDNYGGKEQPDEATDIGTELSRRTDRTSYTVPEDGREITIRPPKGIRPHDASSQQIKDAQASQTSLLIEYFEGSKTEQHPSRPSVRVRVRPSSGSAGRRSSDGSKSNIEKRDKTASGHVRASQPSYTHRITLAPSQGSHGSSDVSSSSPQRDQASKLSEPSSSRRSRSDSIETSATAKRSSDRTRRPPVRIEVIGGSPELDSSRSPSRSSRAFDGRKVDLNPSEISSMPPDSLLNGTQAKNGSLDTEQPHNASAPSQSETKTEDVQGQLTVPSAQNVRSLSRERLVHKAMEKLTASHRSAPNKTDKISTRHKGSPEPDDELMKPMRHQEVDPGSLESFDGVKTHVRAEEASLSSQSTHSNRRQSLPGKAVFQSTTSRSSLSNNPRLLETVESAIRRLIMPEIEHLKQQQALQKDVQQRRRHRRHPQISDHSTASSSDVPLRLTKHASAPNVSTRQHFRHEPMERLSGRSLNENVRSLQSGCTSGVNQDSLQSITKPSESSFDPAQTDRPPLTSAALKRLEKRQKSLGSRASIDDAAQHDAKDNQQSSKSPASQKTTKQQKRSLSKTVEEAHVLKMPLQSDINSSDFTRESILSEITDMSSLNAGPIQKTAKFDQVSPNSQTKPASLREGAISQSVDAPIRQSGTGIVSLTGQQNARELGSLAAPRNPLDYTPPKRTLSPIESVSSRHESESLDNTSRKHSIHKNQPGHTSRSTSRAPEDKALGARSDHTTGHAIEAWLDHEHEKNEHYRSMSSAKQGKNSSDQPTQTLQALKCINLHFTSMPVESAVASLLDSSVSSSAFPDGSRQSSPVKSLDMESRDHLTERSFESPSDVQDGIEKHHIKQDSPIPMGASGLPVPEDPMPEIGHGLEQDSSDHETPRLGFSNASDFAPTRRSITPRSNEKTDSVHSVPEQATYRTNTLQHSSRSPEYETQELNNPTERDHNSQSRADSSYDTIPHAEGRVSDTYHPNEKRPSKLAFKDARSFSDGGQDLSDGDSFHEDYDDRDVLHKSRQGAMDPRHEYDDGFPLYEAAIGHGMDRIQSQDVVALMDHLTVRDAERNARDTEILVTLVRSAAEMRNSFEEMKRFIAEQDNQVVEASKAQHHQTLQQITDQGLRSRPYRKSDRSAGIKTDEDVPSKRRNFFRRALQGLSSRGQNDIERLEDRLEQLLNEVDSLKLAPQASEYQDTTREAMARHTSYQVASPARIEPISSQPYNASPSSKPKRSSLLRLQPLNSSPSGYFAPIRTAETFKPIPMRVSMVPEEEERSVAQQSSSHDEQQHRLNMDFEHDDDLLTPTQARMRSTSLQQVRPPELPSLTELESPGSSLDRPLQSSETRGKHESGTSTIPKISRWSKTTTSSAGPGCQQSEDNSPRRVFFEEEPSDNVRPISTRPPSPLISRSQLSLIADDPKYQAHRDSQNLEHPQPRQGPTHRYQHHLETQAQKYSVRSPVALSPTTDTFGSDPALARYLATAMKSNNANATGYHDSAHAKVSPRGNRENVLQSPSTVASSDCMSMASSARNSRIREDGPLIPIMGTTPSPAPTISSPIPLELKSTHSRQSPSSMNGARPSPKSTRHSLDSHAPNSNVDDLSLPCGAAAVEKQEHQAQASTESLPKQGQRMVSSSTTQSSSPRPSSQRLVTPQRRPTGPRPITSSGSYKITAT